MDTWEELLDSGDLEGYDSTFNHIDNVVANETPCDECGGNCRYEGRTNYKGSYRAFSVCNACDHVVEF